MLLVSGIVPTLSVLRPVIKLPVKIMASIGAQEKSENLEFYRLSRPAYWVQLIGYSWSRDWGGRSRDWGGRSRDLVDDLESCMRHKLPNYERPIVKCYKMMSAQCVISEECRSKGTCMKKGMFTNLSKPDVKVHA